VIEDRPAHEEPTAERPRIRLCDHPRARRHIELARGWAGIGAFALTALLSHNAGVGAFTVGVRALACGIAAYMAAWALAVLVWRQLAVAEAKAAREAAEARRRALLEEIERRAAERAAEGEADGGAAEPAAAANGAPSPNGAARASTAG